MVALTGIEPDGCQVGSVRLRVSSCVFSAVGIPRWSKTPPRTADVTAQSQRGRELRYADESAPLSRIPLLSILAVAFRTYNRTETMGYEKDRMIQEGEQGWRFRGGNICFRCISDRYLKQMVKDQASEMDCDFCLRQSRKAPISIPFDSFMEVYAVALFQYYSHAENEPIAWDSEDHEYVGTTYDTWDLVKDVIGEPSENEEFVQAIIDSLGHNIWCDKSPYCLTGAELYQTSWESFCQTVKHESRYFFDDTKPDPYSERLPVSA